MVPSRSCSTRSGLRLSVIFGLSASMAAARCRRKKDEPVMHVCLFGRTKGMRMREFAHDGLLSTPCGVLLGHHAEGHALYNRLGGGEWGGRTIHRKHATAQHQCTHAHAMSAHARRAARPAHVFSRRAPSTNRFFRCRQLKLRRRRRVRQRSSSVGERSRTKYGSFLAFLQRF